MASLSFDDAERRLGQLPRTFFSCAAAAEQLGISVDEARRLLTKMKSERMALRVCREGWLLTWRYRPDEQREAPVLAAYLDDMMRHLGVGYYLSYAAAARMRGASHHGVMRKRVNVETDDLDALELRQADGPVDLAISFHRIDPQHARPVTTVQTECSILLRTGSERTDSGRRVVRVATIETALLDMMEHPDRVVGVDHAATIAVKALFWGLLDPEMLAEASDLYPPLAGRRAGSMLQQLRGFQHRLNLRPLHRRVRARGIGPPIEMRSGKIDTTRKPDRWGVTYAGKLDPDY